MKGTENPISLIANDQPPASLRRALGPFGFTMWVLGAVVGADVYIVASMGAGYLGPAQLVAWLAGGLLPGLIVLSFVQCSYMDPELGGRYAYVRNAFGPTAGFLPGWTLYMGESVVLPIFPTGLCQLT